MKQIGIWWLFFMLFLGNELKAQSPYFYTINDENGLPSNEVYQVTQDAFGFMWIACDAGLYRYDGFKFVAYSNKKQNSQSLSNLFVDESQHIWSQNFTGQIFNTRADMDSLSIIYDGSNNSKIAPVYAVDSKCNAWIATDSMLLVVDTIGRFLKSFSTKDLGASNNVWFDILCVEDKIYALNYKAELFIIDASNYNIDKRQIQEDSKSRLSLFNLNNRVILFAEDLPIRHYRVSDITTGKEKPLAHFPPPSASGTSYKITKCQENLLLCTSSGVLLLDQNFKQSTSKLPLFEQHKISYAYCDKEGNHWFTSLQDGIFIVPSMDVQVFSVANSILRDNNISSISLYSDSVLYIGNYSGEVYQLLIEKKQLDVVAKNSESKYRAVREIAKKNTTIYAARGLFSIIKGKETSNIPQLNNVRDFVIARDTIYYTRSDASGFVSKEAEGWKQHILRKNGGKKVLLDSFRKIAYYACSNGLYQYQSGVLEEIRFENESIFGSSLSLDDNRLWVGTNNKGVLVLENKKVVQQFNAENLLSDNKVKALHKQGNHVYVACRQGLNIIELDKKTAFVINEFDGLAFKEINDIAIGQEMIYLASIKGLVQLPIGFNWKNELAPRIQIVAAQKNNQPVDIHRPIALNYNENNLKIEFIATAFRSRTHFNYKYRLKNFEDSWLLVNGSTASINFSSLPPGQYIFEVVAVNEDGVASLKPAQLSINVYAPIWQKWWFYLLFSLFFVGIVALIFRARLQFIERKAAIENKLAVSQLTALKAQMNPHFMYNALNSIQALNIRKETKLANFYLSKFSLLMRKVLEASGEEFIALQDEIEWLSLYVELEKLRFGDDFHYEFMVDDNVDTYQVYIPSMILQPFIENAIKHGLLHKTGHKKLEIHFECTDKLVCTITDNGVGRKKVGEIQKRQQANHKSFATKATQKRIELLNYKAKDTYSFDIIDLYDREEALGTKVIVSIPLQN